MSDDTEITSVDPAPEPDAAKPKKRGKSKRATKADSAEEVAADVVHVDNRGPGFTSHAKDCECLTLTPGLNAVPVSHWATYIKHPPVAERIESGTVSEIKLDDVFGDDLVDLAARTTRRECITHLLDREVGKPVTAGKRTRKSDDVLAILNRKRRKF